MRILFFGDSITDAQRDRTHDFCPHGLGTGFVNAVASTLLYENPERYEIINRGIGGNRIVDLYSRIKCDCWNLNPDIISILIGVNDVWHEVLGGNGVELDRFEKVYRMIIEDTKKALPNAKLIICEPFVLKGRATEERYDDFLSVKQYAKICKDLATEYNIPFVELQKPIEEFNQNHAEGICLYDGVHPNIAGAHIIASEWLKTFKTKVDKQ